MISVYNDNDYLKAHKQKKKLFTIFMITTIVYVGLCVGLLLYHCSLPYASRKAAAPKWGMYIASVLYSIFLFVFMGISYSRVNKYCKMLYYVSTGLKHEEVNYFYCFDEKDLQKDNVDVKSCVFETWNKKKCEWMEREAYFDPEMPLPPFESGDCVRYITQSNFVIQYDILQKKALEFEEVDDEEEYEEAEEELEEVEEITEE